MPPIEKQRIDDNAGFAGADLRERGFAPHPTRARRPLTRHLKRIPDVAAGLKRLLPSLCRENVISGISAGAFRVLPAWLVLCLAAPFYAVAATAPVTIVYTTDTHGHIATDDDTIGLDLIARVKSLYPKAVLLDSGDFLHGAPLAGFDQGKTVTALMCRAGYAAAAVGNHEFDHGLAALRSRAREAAAAPEPMAVLSANVRDKDGSLLFAPWFRTTVDSIELCVFGLTTEETKTQTASPAVAGVTFDDVPETAARTTAALKRAGCDIVIALTHVGSHPQVATPSTALARTTPELDVVLDGHSHLQFATLLSDGPIAVSSGAHGRAVGKLELFVDQETKKISAARNTFLSRRDLADLAPDGFISGAIAAYTTVVDTALSRVVAVAEKSLDGDRLAMRTRETPLGSLAADAFRAAYGTDAALCNAGSIRSGIAQGEITSKDMLAVFPFSNHLVSMTVSGRELRDLLEHGFGKLPGAAGAFPQISGLTVTVDAAAPPGYRVRGILIAGEQLRDNAAYTLTTNDFLAQGGDGYPHLAGKQRLQSWMTAEEAFAGYVRKNGIPETNGPPRILFAGTAAECRQ